MTHSIRPRKKVVLSESTLQRLNLYVAAAGAAGVSLLASAQRAAAEIVYTPARVQISNRPSELFYIDLNHDGVNDFFVAADSGGGGFTGLYTLLTVRPLYSSGNKALNGVDGSPPSRPNLYYAHALEAGAVIGSGKRFDSCRNSCTSFALVMARVSKPHFDRGGWANVSNRYLGLKLVVNGETQYGWARMSVHIKGNIIQADLTGYAYETTPNQPIVAGQTSGTFGDQPFSVDESNPAGSAQAIRAPTLVSASLGLLALGAPGVPLWRRKAGLSAGH